LKIDSKGISQEENICNISVEYLGSISGNKLREGYWGTICRIFWGGF
jgi:hypothetical protein